MSFASLLPGALVMAPMTKGSNLPYRQLCVELRARQPGFGRLMNVTSSSNPFGTGHLTSASRVRIASSRSATAGSSAAVAAILVHHTSPVAGVPVPTLHGYLLAFVMAGAVAVVAAVAAWCIPAEPAGGADGVLHAAEGGAKDDGIEGGTEDGPRGARDEALEGA